ncbi:PTS sugar transporter subunit IIA [Streptomyces sp. NPDC059740]|uniref:PTS sugar transporter subunit IIA n=1 Tax=Streptomyces sp. NPDC059740 TaxID=3346926 RepID=UPI0036500EAA
MTALTGLLPPEAMEFEASARDWREAVRLAGAALTRSGSATEAYTREMVASVEENGPYIVLAPGFAFAHARPSPAVRRTGMSWVRLTQPVEFGHESNDPVDLVVALAAADSAAHTEAMAALARLLTDPATEAALRSAATPGELLRVLGGKTAQTADAGTAEPEEPSETEETAEPAQTRGAEHHTLLTVCGNGVGTSLFLKNTLEQVLQRWGWSGHVTVEATDTISARGKAADAVAVLTSREIARALGDLGVPVQVVEDFTSTTEVDRVLRATYRV